MGIQTLDVALEVPDGWELTGEYRQATEGETVLCNGKANACPGGSATDYPILRRRWDWPEWIRSGSWIAMDANGDWCCFTDKPEIQDQAWVEGLSDETSSTFLTNGQLTFTAPFCEDWRQSARQKP